MPLCLEAAQLMGHGMGERAAALPSCPATRSVQVWLCNTPHVNACASQCLCDATEISPCSLL